jgi:hypothetical protein
MVWRYVKAQLMVLLCGGLVGPIFLAVYFATGQDALLKWMFYVGLLVTAADVLIALAIANFGAKSAAKAQALEQSGVLALAQITGMGETGTRINDQPVVKLQLHIGGPGFAPFSAQDRVIASVTRLGNLTSRKLVTLVNPATQEFHIDWERSALINGLVPATFTVAEDNQDLRPQRSDRRADGDLADPQGKRHRHEQHDRSAVQPGRASTGSIRRPACRSAAGARRTRLGPSRGHAAAAVSGDADGAVDLTAAAGTGDPARDRSRLRGGVHRQAGADSFRSVILLEP